ncbi:hypothetical protein AM571_PC01699 (plasmid) [Rhizobium etli 8C-3]|uniref:Uncharacterized protein n=1 Tax=Rhizobium etli 8C-3 TaxID=538025 RepID=A0A1L5PHC9_RHIET|nr:hypothetical protein AM571_PC01699 [Rhizobium etli 8C-3]
MRPLVRAALSLLNWQDQVWPAPIVAALFISGSAELQIVVSISVGDRATCSAPRSSGKVEAECLWQKLEGWLSSSLLYAAGGHLVSRGGHCLKGCTGDHSRRGLRHSS